MRAAATRRALFQTLDVVRSHQHRSRLGRPDQQRHSRRLVRQAAEQAHETDDRRLRRLARCARLAVYAQNVVRPRGFRALPPQQLNLCREPVIRPSLGRAVGGHPHLTLNNTPDASTHHHTKLGCRVDLTLASLVLPRYLTCSCAYAGARRIRIRCR